MSVGFQCSENHGRAVGIAWGIVLIIPFFIPFPFIYKNQLILIWSWDLLSSAGFILTSSGWPLADKLFDLIRLVFALQLLGGPVCIAVAQIPNRFARFMLMAAASVAPATILVLGAGSFYADYGQLLTGQVSGYQPSAIEQALAQMSGLLELGSFYFNIWLIAPVFLLLVLLWGWREDNKNPMRLLLLALCIVAVALGYLVGFGSTRSFFSLVTTQISGPLWWIQLLHFAPLVVAALSLLTIIRAAFNWQRERIGGGRFIAALGLSALVLLPATLPVGIVDHIFESPPSQAALEGRLQEIKPYRAPFTLMATALFLPAFHIGILSRWAPFLFVLGSAINGLLSFRTRISEVADRK